MIGSKIVIAALAFLPVAVTTLMNNPDQDRHDELMSRARIASFVIDGRVEIPVAKYCNFPRSWFPLANWIPDKICTYAIRTAKEVHKLESSAFCSHVECDAKYNPLTGLCQCPWGKPENMVEESAWPGKDCNKTTICYAPYEAHWNPYPGACVCAVETFSKLRHATILFDPNPMKNLVYGPSQNTSQAPTIQEQTQAFVNEVKELKRVHLESINALEKKMKEVQLALKDLGRVLFNTTTESHNKIKRRVVRRSTVSLAPLPTYIPPPNTEVTQELLQESLLIQPQQFATVGSVIPKFSDGVITFLVQLDGPISQTLALNAPDTLPCETIGATSPQSLILVPQNVKNGTAATFLPDCLIIAVNTYTPQYITYWVQKNDGSIYTLLSDNKIHAIDQLDTSLPASIAIRVAPTGNHIKREVNSNINVATLKRRQIFSIACDRPCPFYHMDRVVGSDNYCGCLFKGADQNVNLDARGVEEPSQYTATMTAEACAAMTCINNGGNPALFNPFTATCWCASPAFVEVNENAYSDGM